MRFRADFYKTDDPASVRSEFLEANTFFKAVSTAQTMCGCNWSQLSVTEVLPDALLPVLVDDVRGRFLRRCG